MNIIWQTIKWFSDGSHWSGDMGIPHRVLEHVEVSAFALVLATALALPIGLLIGHTRRGELIAVSIGNLGRALPSFGILAIIFPLTLRYAPGSIGFPPTLITLALLGIAPILTNSYVGIQNVDPDAVEAARGMGLSGGQVLRSLELPLAAPLIVAGLRTAAVQIVATATLGAVFAFGGLGSYIVLGFAVNDHAEILAGALLVAVLAIVTEVSFAFLERAVSPRLASKKKPSDAPAEPAVANQP